MNTKYWLAFALLVLLVFVWGSLRNPPSKPGSPATDSPGKDPGAYTVPVDPGTFTKLPRPDPETPAQKEIRQRLQRMICPMIEFEDTTPEEAVDFFRLMRWETDRPGRDRLPLIVRRLREGEQVPPGMEEEDVPLKGKTIKQLSLRNVPMWDALHIVAREADLELTLTDLGLEISAK